MPSLIRSIAESYTATRGGTAYAASGPATAPAWRSPPHRSPSFSDTSERLSTSSRSSATPAARWQIWAPPTSSSGWRRAACLGVTARTAWTAALLQLAADVPADVLARCLGIDISSAVTWQRTAAGDWHPNAARIAERSKSWHEAERE